MPLHCWIADSRQLCLQGAVRWGILLTAMTRSEPAMHGCPDHAIHRKPLSTHCRLRADQ